MRAENGLDYMDGVISIIPCEDGETLVYKINHWTCGSLKAETKQVVKETVVQKTEYSIPIDGIIFVIVVSAVVSAVVSMVLKRNV